MEIGIYVLVLKILLFLSIFVHQIFGAASSNNSPSPYAKDSDLQWKCVPIKIDFCKDIPYNMAIEMNIRKPNPYTHKTTQSETEQELKHYQSMLDSECSKYTRLLLCSVYLPYCNKDIVGGITACKYLCEEVRHKCLKKYPQFKKLWPKNLNCSRFPEENSEKTHCSDGGLKAPRPATTTSLLYPSKKTMFHSSVEKELITTTPVISPYVKTTYPETYCSVMYSKNVKNFVYVRTLQACTLECNKDGLFSRREKEIAERFMLVLACLCGVLSIAALITVRFSWYQEIVYPERCIVFITLCYSLYSCAYIVRIIYSRESVTCQEENGRRYMLVDGSANISCAFTFLLSYCASMVHNLWWVILCLTWFLRAGMKWSSQDIQSKSFFFHIVAWVIPCCFTVIVLVLKKIDVNELTGVCSVGNRFENLRALSWFVLAPLFTFLVMASMFLLSGLFSLFLLPTHREEQTKSRNKLKEFLLPVGAYAILHTILSTVILASYFYEYVNKNTWYHESATLGPNYIIFIIRIACDFIIGVTAALRLLFVHGPRLYRKIRVKFYETDLLLSSRDSTDRINSIKSQTDTTETSI